MLRYLLLSEPKYYSDGLISSHNVDFMQDKRFLTSFEQAHEFLPDRRTDFFRIYILTYFFEYALLKHDGCFVELGTYLGFGMKHATIYTDFQKYTDRQLLLFDSFEGIQENNLELDGRDKVKYHEISHEKVLKKFGNLENCKITKGFLPESLDKFMKEDSILEKGISFLHVDLNNAQAEIESLKILYPLLIEGAIIIFDDYAYSDLYRLQHDMADDFFEKIGRRILTLPTGQGLFIK